WLILDLDSLLLVLQWSHKKGGDIILVFSRRSNFNKKYSFFGGDFMIVYEAVPNNFFLLLSKIVAHTR
ncbi:hypothetical protein ACJX0J_015936, partial [Zea mays]